MKTLITTITLLILSGNTFGQIISEKIKTAHYFNGKLAGKKKESKYYDIYGNLIKEVSMDAECGEPNVDVFEYYYDSSNRLTNKVFYARGSYRTKETLIWRPISKIDSNVYEYNKEGLLSIEKEFIYSCDFEKADVSEYFYENKKLVRKYCLTECSQGPRSHMFPFNFPTYYTYDINDSLICEKVMEAKDTTKIWYMKEYDYLTIPNCKIFKHYYKKGDSLKLEYYDISQDFFDSTGQKIMTTYKNEVSRDYSTTSNYTTFYKYNNRKQLIEEYSKNNESEIFSRIKYKYFKNGRMRTEKEYEWNDKNKLKLRLFIQYKYLSLRSVDSVPKGVPSYQ